MQNPHWKLCESHIACCSGPGRRRRQPLDRGDLGCRGLDREHQARAHRPAVEEHRARAADAVLAAEVRPGQARGPRAGSRPASCAPRPSRCARAVDGQVDVLGHCLSSALSAAACRPRRTSAAGDVVPVRRATRAGRPAGRYRRSRGGPPPRTAPPTASRRPGRSSAAAARTGTSDMPANASRASLIAPSDKRQRRGQADDGEVAVAAGHLLEADPRARFRGREPHLDEELVGTARRREVALEPLRRRDHPLARPGRAPRTRHPAPGRRRAARPPGRRAPGCRRSCRGCGWPRDR